MIGIVIFYVVGYFFQTTISIYINNILCSLLILDIIIITFRLSRKILFPKMFFIRIQTCHCVFYYIYSLSFLFPRISNSYVIIIFSNILRLCNLRIFQHRTVNLIYHFKSKKKLEIY